MILLFVYFFASLAGSLSLGQTNTTFTSRLDQPLSYTVQTGDTIEALARLFIVREDEIRTLNHILRNKEVVPGTTIKIPINTFTEQSTNHTATIIRHDIADNAFTVAGVLATVFSWILPILTLIVLISKKGKRTLHDHAFTVAALAFLFRTASSTLIAFLPLAPNKYWVAHLWFWNLWLWIITLGAIIIGLGHLLVIQTKED